MRAVQRILGIAVVLLVWAQLWPPALTAAKLNRTVRAASPETAPVTAVIVATPDATAVTRPVALTVATPIAEDVQLNV